MPTEGIPIISPQRMFDQAPTDIVIFPWNISKELLKTISRLGSSNMRVWVAIPELKQVL